jgi:hypothetical protein
MVRGSDLSDWHKFEQQLGQFRKQAVPYATREALTATAFAAMKAGRRFVKREFVTRNKHTVRTLRAEPAKSLSRPESAFGSVEPYMATQELGGVKRAGGGRSAPLPTGASAGQRGQQPRTKLPTPANRMRRIQLKQRAQGKNKRQSLAIAINSVASGGHVFLEFRPRSRGIFRVSGPRKRGGKGRRRKIVMIHNLARSSHRIPPSPWLQPTAKRTGAEVMPRLYGRALKKQLQRRGLF